MSREEEFKSAKEKMTEVKDSLSVGMASGLFELREIVNEFREVRDQNYLTELERYDGRTAVDGGYFNQSLRKLEEALKECLFEYKKAKDLKNLGESMALDVQDKFASDTRKKHSEDLKHWNSTEKQWGNSDFEKKFE